MKKMILSIAIILVTAGLAAPSAMAREMRGDAMSRSPGVEMRGPMVLELANRCLQWVVQHIDMACASTVAQQA